MEGVQAALVVWQKTVVMVPTYNEAQNIESRVRRLVAAAPEVTILVVDDDSPDGTAAIVRRLSTELPQVELLLRREQRGRGRAGIAGYRRALELGADQMIEMDADLSHRPEHLPAILEALRTHDVVIGSRYVPGGRDGRRGIHRRLISRVANFYTRTVLGVPIRDCTSGYRGYRAEVLRTIGADRLETWGPAILSDVLWRIKLAGFQIGEIPIQFVDRERGESTLTTRILLEGLWNVLRLRITVRSLEH